jgi:hypothetical protein
MAPTTQIETLIETQLTDRNKTTALFRYILIAPIAIFVWSLSVTLAIPVALALIFRGIYPSYLLTFNHALMELNLRVATYALLLTDDYPSIERNSKFAILFPDVDGGKKLNRGLPLVKWLLAIPLYIVGALYALVALAITVIAWVSVSLTGNYPEWGKEIVVGTLKFWNRVLGYAYLLVTDEYPSFKL